MRWKKKNCESRGSEGSLGEAGKEEGEIPRKPPRASDHQDVEHYSSILILIDNCTLIPVNVKYCTDSHFPTG